MLSKLSDFVVKGVLNLKMINQLKTTSCQFMPLIIASTKLFYCVQTANPRNRYLH